MEKNLPEYYSKLVKNNLRRLKRDRGWTTKEMSIETGVSEGYLNSLLSLAVNKVPTIYMRGVICQQTDLEIQYFFEEHSEQDIQSEKK